PLLIGIPWRWNQSAAVRGPRDKTKWPDSDIFLQFKLLKECASLADMTNDKDSLDIYTTTSLEPAAESDKKGKIEDLLLASFLALALDLILSACRFLSSSS
ncbi:hypothetical protein KUCAC02_012440, partial [Chaenocephalus aceratus]